MLATVLLTGCSTSEPQPAPEPAQPTVNTDIAASVPAPIRERGTLTVATDPNYPPMEFLNVDGELTGAEIDLVTAVAEVMDLAPDYTVDAFSAIPTAVRTGQFDLGAATLTVRPDRPLRNNAVVFAQSGSQLISSGDIDLQTASRCGLEIGALEGTFQINQLLQEAKACRNEQLPQLKVIPFANLESATAALTSNKISLFLTESIVSESLLTSYPDLLSAIGPVREVLPVAWVTSPDARKLTRTVKRALQQLIDSGYYETVMKEYDIRANSLTSPRIIWANDDQKSPTQRTGSG